MWIFGRRNKNRTPPRAPSGERAYAIGDVHGRLDLLDRLLAAIEADLRGRPPLKTRLVFLGDLIDRGPNSREVVERLRTLRMDGVVSHFLAGNHEEVLLRLLDGDHGLLANWLTYGGAECLASYGLDPGELAKCDDEASALARVKQAIPEAHASFIASFADTLSFGDYLFVHAGIRPGVELSLQAQADLHWIRGAFLDDDTDHGRVIVHGHTISDAVEWRSNRIGIDTGAYRSGVLTALGLEGEQRWLLHTAGNAGTGPDQANTCPAGG